MEDCQTDRFSPAASANSRSVADSPCLRQGMINVKVEHVCLAGPKRELEIQSEKALWPDGAPQSRKCSSRRVLGENPETIWTDANLTSHGHMSIADDASDP